MRILIILSFGLFLGYVVAHPMAYAMMYLDEYEVDRNIYKGEVNVR